MSFKVGDKVCRIALNEPHCNKHAPSIGSFGVVVDLGCGGDELVVVDFGDVDGVKIVWRFSVAGDYPYPPLSDLARVAPSAVEAEGFTIRDAATGERWSKDRVDEAVRRASR